MDDSIILPAWWLAPSPCPSPADETQHTQRHRSCFSIGGSWSHLSFLTEKELKSQFWVWNIFGLQMKGSTASSTEITDVIGNAQFSTHTHTHTTQMCFSALEWERTLMSTWLLQPNWFFFFFFCSKPGSRSLQKEVNSDTLIAQLLAFFRTFTSLLLQQSAECWPDVLCKRLFYIIIHFIWCGGMRKQ